jgi:ketosteroid isomerase-like protein
MPPRTFYLTAIQRYFDTMDVHRDPDLAADCFAPDGSLTCVSDGEVYVGRAALRQFFADIIGNSHRMLHRPTNIVIDTEAGTCATEQDYDDDMRDGRRYNMLNCNFYEFNTEGKFTRVRFWMGKNRE